MRFLCTLLFTLLLVADTHAQDDDAYNRLTQQAATYYYANKDYKRSAETLEAAIALKDRNAGYTERFNAACAWSMAGNKDNAFKHLDYLAAAIMTDPGGRIDKENQDPLFYMFDSDLAPLHEDKRWGQFIARLQKRRTPLVNMLDSIYIDDQAGRRKLEQTAQQYGRNSKEVQELWDDINTKDSINLVRIRALIDSCGWLGEDSIGKHGSSALFLVIQHSDQQTQEHYLPMMREAVKDGRAKASALALLEDRVALGKGQRQLYGSQVGTTPEGAYYVLPLEDPDHVDERRRSMGLPGMKYYLSNWNLEWDAETYKKQLPEIEKMQDRVRGGE